MPKKKDIWKHVIQIIRTNYDPAHVDPWFFHTQLKALDQNQAVIHVPNRFVAIWLKERFLEAIQSAIYKICGYRPDICFTYGSNSISPKIPLPSSLPPVFQSAFNQKYTFETFIPDNKNRFAYASALTFAESCGQQFNPLFIFGPLTVGKTHLLHAVGNRISQNNPSLKVGYISSKKFISHLSSAAKSQDQIERLRSQFISLDLFILDDIQHLTDYPIVQTELLSICDHFLAHKKPLLFAANRSPASMDNLNRNLASRLGAGILAEIPALDHQTKLMILERRAADQVGPLADDVLFYLTTLTDDLSTLLNILDCVSQLNRENRQPIELTDIKRVTKHLTSDTLTIAQIQGVVAEHFGVSPSELASDKREKRICYPRHVAIYLCKELLGLSLKEIAKGFGKKNHSSMLYAIRSIENKIRNDRNLQEHIKRLRDALI
ncbi:MAG: ATP-binding protein [Deltaproteobacteria bacterium]|mgnify:CR=1 FL=1|nr:ATP-binding protein [Deltaproteobacteria bacterium]MBW1927573.1 ATP-binding protein [Deltaproteobacteria bacterium]MBW2024637.1 ATP-binding protein [Deltaproteobacteria bacterium]MBW2124794.1 ATP-binding protein [Deltaproteobacteria bacterium]